MQKKLPVIKTALPPFDEYINEIKDLWDTHLLTNMGVKHKLLEEQLLRYLDTPHLSLYANGHLALEAVIEAFDLKGEVITSPFTFASTTHAIVRKGLTPVFCDINKTDYTIDPTKIENLITKKTSAIIPIHVYGNLCDVKAIETVAGKHGLKVIYDAAHAFGVTENNQNCANFGDASIFSFHATKVFHTVEGGVVTTKNKKIKTKLDKIKNFGFTNEGFIDYIGGNAKMNELQAAMGICNLRHVNKEILKRKHIVQMYNKNLKNIPGIVIPKDKVNIDSNYSYYPVVFERYKKNRDNVCKELIENNILSRKYFYPLTSDFRCNKNKYDANSTPIAKQIAESILCLPLFSEMNKEDVDRVCEIIINGEES